MAAVTEVSIDTENKARIRWHIENFARGRESAISVPRIARDLHLDERHLRDLVSDLAEEDGMIGSSSDRTQPGYYWIQNYDEARDAAAQLHSRARKIDRRARALVRKWPKLAQDSLFPS